MLINQAPQSIDELMQRAKALSGRSLGALALEQGIEIPANLRTHKGWVGQLLEHCLGADAGSRAMPDFTRLGVELKTLPLDHTHQPKESTFVCSIPLLKIHQETWETSLVYHKLKHVLWVPLEAASSIPLPHRCVGNAFLWEPSAEHYAQLKQDWCELTEKIIYGQFEDITAKQGKYLQIRPKGANAKVLVDALDAHGDQVKTLPRGFYLRPTFTSELLSAN